MGYYIIAVMLTSFHFEVRYSAHYNSICARLSEGHVDTITHLIRDIHDQHVALCKGGLGRYERSGPGNFNNYAHHSAHTLVLSRLHMHRSRRLTEDRERDISANYQTTHSTPKRRCRAEGSPLLSIMIIDFVYHPIARVIIRFWDRFRPT